MSKRQPLVRRIRTLRQRFGDVERIDFFNAAGRAGVASILAQLEQLAEPPRGEQPATPQSILTPADFRKARWVTRPRPGVDRMSSAWLIRRFIDPTATFAFVEKPGPSDTPFDMYEGAFTHQGSFCTFETLARRLGVTAPAVVRIGHIVHDLDMKETRYGAAETPAVERIIEGLRELYPDDHALLEQGITLFEALARSFTASEERPSTGRRRARTRQKAKKRAR